jgi:hypothetical protein
MVIDAVPIVLLTLAAALVPGLGLWWLTRRRGRRAAPRPAFDPARAAVPRRIAPAADAAAAGNDPAGNATGERGSEAPRRS